MDEAGFDAPSHYSREDAIEIDKAAWERPETPQRTANDYLRNFNLHEYLEYPH